MNLQTGQALDFLMNLAQEKYGDFASTHEALGVCVEEWQEFRDAIHANDLTGTRREALDLAAALIRLHDQLGASDTLRARSGMAA